jgi:hypothetical protein
MSRKIFNNINVPKTMCLSKTVLIEAVEPKRGSEATKPWEKELLKSLHPRTGTDPFWETSFDKGKLPFPHPHPEYTPLALLFTGVY